ncbi:hypothetical protein [Microbacterium sp. NPDC089696]|uniref:hypothetical protein n=1 Tax=Microbacterium sp. NPDC089696 TaxID=3364199 RepID=UPI00380C8727
MTYRPRSVVALQGGRGWLTAESAASIHRIDRRIGHLLQITEAGRSFFRQDEHWQAYRRYLNGGPWAPIALDPDTPSVHQIGDAIDSDEAQQILAIMADHGWVRTVYRWVGGKWTLVERWHFEHFIEKDNHRYEGDPAGAASTPVVRPDQSEEDEMPDSMFAHVGGVPSWCWLNWATGQVFAVHTQAEGDWVQKYMGPVRSNWWGDPMGDAYYRNRLALFGILCPKVTIERGHLSDEDFARLEQMISAGVKDALAGAKA